MSDWDAYWTALQTSIAGGDAPDVFAMDGPHLPGLPVARGAAGPPTVHRAGRVRPDRPRGRWRGPLHNADGGQYGLPRDLNVVGLYYNKAMFDAAGIPYPDETWDWDKLVEVGKQLTLDADGNGQPEQWGFYTESTDMENFWSELVWQNGGEIISEDRTQTLLGSEEVRRWPAVPPGPDLHPQGDAHPGRVRVGSAMPSSRGRRPWNRTGPGSCRPIPPRGSTSASRHFRPGLPVRQPASTPPERWCRPPPTTRRPPGSS